MTPTSLSLLTISAACFGFAAPPEGTEPAPVDLSFDASARVEAAPPGPEAPPSDPSVESDGSATDTVVDGAAPSDAATPYGSPPVAPNAASDGWQNTHGGYATPYADRPQRTYPEIPIKWRAELGLAAASNIGTHPTYQIADANGRSLAMEASLRGDARLGKSRFFLGGTIGYRRIVRDWSRGPLGVTDSYQSESREPKAGLRASVMAIEGVDVMLQVQGGVSVLRSELFIWDGNGTSARQVDVLPLVEPGAGVLLYLPKKWLPRRGSSRVTVGLELSASYAWRGPARLQPALDQADDDIPAQPVSFGTIRTSGVNLQGALVLRFM